MLYSRRVTTRSFYRKPLHFGLSYGCSGPSSWRFSSGVDSSVQQPSCFSSEEFPRPCPLSVSPDSTESYLSLLVLAVPRTAVDRLGRHPDTASPVPALAGNLRRLEPSDAKIREQHSTEADDHDQELHERPEVRNATEKLDREQERSDTDC